MIQACKLRKNEYLIVDKYVVAYPQLATLAANAKLLPQAAKILGDEISKLQYPTTLSAIECFAGSKIGIV